MADTHSPRLRLAKFETNSHKNTWGADFIDEVLTPLEFSIAGVTTLAMTGDVTLTANNGVADQARAAVINVTSTGGVARTITIPSVEKLYKVRNAGTSTILVKTAADTGVSILQGTTAEVFCDGSACYRAWVSGWGRLTSVGMTSGTSKNIVFTVTGQAFTRARLTCNFGISPASIVQLKVNGPAGSSSAVNMIASTTAVQGEITINSLTSDLGAVRNETQVVATSPGLVAVTPTTLVFRMVGGITDITLTSANAFNAGSILVDMQ